MMTRRATFQTVDRFKDESKFYHVDVDASASGIIPSARFYFIALVYSSGNFNRVL